MDDKSVIFTAYNHHTPECGTPPHLDSLMERRYVGYFENEYGEQWIFVYDSERAEATLYGGDIGWEEPHTFKTLDQLSIVFNEPEKLWLTACWNAANKS